MRIVSAILVPFGLIIYLVNLIFQISAHVENNHLTETVFMNSYMSETIGNLNTPFTIPYWCFLVEVFVYFLTFACIILHSGAEILGRSSRVPLISMIALDLAKCFDCAWVVPYNRYEILQFNAMSAVQFLLLICGCCFIVRAVRQNSYMKRSVTVHIYMEALVMNAFFGYAAWIFYRMVSDIALGVYAYYEEGDWISYIPTGIFLFGYFFYYAFDVIAFPHEFKWTISPYIVFICVFGGLLSDKNLLVPEITMPGLLVSCIGTVVLVTFLHKLAIAMYCHVSKSGRLFPKTLDI